MTSNERIAVLEAAVRHVVAKDYPGAFVECGVAKGGSTMAMAYTLLELGVKDRDLYLYDTFEGMPEPEDVDRGRFGEAAAKSWRKHRKRAARETWIKHGLEEVRENLLSRLPGNAAPFHQGHGRRDIHRAKCRKAPSPSCVSTPTGTPPPKRSSIICSRTRPRRDRYRRRLLSLDGLAQSRGRLRRRAPDPDLLGGSTTPLSWV